MDAAYNQCKTQMKAVVERAEPEIALLQEGEDQQDIDRVKKAVERLKKSYIEQRDKLYDEKIKEIDEAHENWQINQVEKRRGKFKN